MPVRLDRTNTGENERPPIWRHFYHLRDAFFRSAFQRWRERSSRDESLPVSVSRRCWLTFEPFRIPGLATLYTAPSRSFAVRLVHREGLTDSHGSHPFRASPSLTLCPYYSRSGSACQGVLRIFFADPRTSYSGVLRR